MSRIRTNIITNRMVNGAPVVSTGLRVTGVCTATSFSGDGSNLSGLASREVYGCLLYTSPSPRDLSTSRMPSSA